MEVNIFDVFLIGLLIVIDFEPVISVECGGTNIIENRILKEYFESEVKDINHEKLAGNMINGLELECVLHRKLNKVERNHLNHCAWVDERLVPLKNRFGSPNNKNVLKILDDYHSELSVHDVCAIKMITLLEYESIIHQDCYEYVASIQHLLNPSFIEVNGITNTAKKKKSKTKQMKPNKKPLKKSAGGPAGKTYDQTKAQIDNDHAQDNAAALAKAPGAVTTPAGQYRIGQMGENAAKTAFTDTFIEMETSWQNEQHLYEACTQISFI